MNSDYKQVILVRQDLKLPKGKMAAQVSHAAVECVRLSRKIKTAVWREQGSKKVVLKVLDLAELNEYYDKALQAGLTACLIKDAGHTTVRPGTVTCCGIGPDMEDKIDALTGKLKMM